MDGDMLEEDVALNVRHRTCVTGDIGLDLILPLHRFLRICHKAAYHFLITEFRDAKYINENIDRNVKREMTLYGFLCHINQIFKDVKGGKNSRNKKKSPSSFQASCSNQQQHCILSHHQQQHQINPQTHLNQWTNQPQGTAADQRAAQSIEDLQSKWPSEIQNVSEKENILVKVTIKNLLERGKVCLELYKLDLNFIVNVILNKHIGFRLDMKLINALQNMKRVRQSLIHAKYCFTEDDFEKNLTLLVEAVTVIHEALHFPDHLVQDGEKNCREEANSGNEICEIFNQLLLEAHPKYSLPEHSFVSPNITCSQMQGKEVIEDLQKFIEDQQDNLEPILLCGEEKKVKSKVLERLAYRIIDGNHTRFKLVLYLKDSHSRSCCHLVPLGKDTKTAVQGFQDQMFACLANLIPDTLDIYGLDAIKAVLKINQRNILFLINWNVSVLGPVQSEMQQGTWIITYDGKEPSQEVGWQVLRLEPYTKVQVEEILSYFPNSDDLLRCYHNFDSKDILSSMDMIQIFWEMSETISTGTDFEVVDKYVQRMKQLRGSEEDLLRLGKLAFNALFTRKFVFPEDNISDIQDCVCNSFLYKIEKKGCTFKHSVVRDLLAARYVVSNSSVACKSWIKNDENIVAFKRVFKFVCFMWFQNHNSTSKESLMYMNIFLRKLFYVPDKKEANCSKKKGKSDDKKSRQMKKKEMVESQNKHKNPFDSWVFLLELDEACGGKGEVMKHIASILSAIPCWCFNVDDSLPTKLTRLEKILKKVTLNKKDPLIIKLKSNTNITLLIELWKKLSTIEKLYDCVDLMVTIEGDEATHLSYKNILEDFLKTIADTQVPLYITRYKGPMFSSCIPSFLKCACMRRLKILEVIVYDVKSLFEVMACRALPSLQEVFIKVNLELTEQTKFEAASIEFPQEVPIHITFKYFPNIQQLLDSFKITDKNCPCSLSIHGMYIFYGFRLNLSKFINLKSLNIRCEPEVSEGESLVLDNDAMEVESGMNRLPRCDWMFQILMYLTLPQKLERLLLRNVEFFNDSNQCHITNFFKKWNINRLLVLDTRLSLTGARKILCSQIEAEDDMNEGERKRLRRIESHDMRKLAAKNMRRSSEKREAMKWSKPGGKEVVITSKMQLCSDCSCFPCMCPSKVDCEGSNSYEIMIELINNIYHHNFQSFSYSFNDCTIRKDMCGDLRVECIMKCLTDTAILEIDSNSSLMRFFHPLKLAQRVTLEGTALSPVGVADMAQHLNHIKNSSSSSSRVEHFSLIIETRWHPPESTSPFKEIKCFLKEAGYLSVVHYQCSCTPKCFHVKKTFKGEIIDII